MELDEAKEQAEKLAEQLEDFVHESFMHYEPGSVVLEAAMTLLVAFKANPLGLNDALTKLANRYPREPLPNSTGGDTPTVIGAPLVEILNVMHVVPR